MSTREISQVPLASQARHRGTWLPPRWHWGVKLHSVHFADKFSSASQARLRRTGLQSAPRAVSTQVHLSSCLSSPLLASSDRWTQKMNSGVLEAQSVKFYPFSGELHLKNTSRGIMLCKTLQVKVDFWLCLKDFEIFPCAKNFLFGFYNFSLKMIGDSTLSNNLLQTPPAPPAPPAPTGEAQAYIVIFIPDYGCFRL